MTDADIMTRNHQLADWQTRLDEALFSIVEGYSDIERAREAYRQVRAVREEIAETLQVKPVSGELLKGTPALDFEIISISGPFEHEFGLDEETVNAENRRFSIIRIRTRRAARARRQSPIRAWPSSGDRRPDA